MRTEQENKKLPKVLAISLSTWRNDSGIHTQTDLFKFWNAEQVAQIYTRSDLPDTSVCNSFFQISENAVIKSIFSRRPVGRRVQNGADPDSSTQKATLEEKRLYAIGHKRKSWLLTIAREIVWNVGCWKSDALNNSFAMMIQNFIQMTGTLILLFVLSWRLSLVVLIFYVFMFAYIRFSSAKSKSYFSLQQKNIGLINGFIEEMISGQKVVKVFNHENANQTQFEHFNRKLQIFKDIFLKNNESHMFDICGMIIIRT